MRKWLLLLATIIPATAHAATWAYIGTSKTGTDYSYDKDTISRKGTLVTAWIFSDFTRDKTEKARTGKDQFVVDCEDRTMDVLYSIRYAADGTVISRYDLSSTGKPTPVAPDTIGDAVLVALCAAI